MSNYDEFIFLNKFNKEMIEKALYLDIRELILQGICEKMKKDDDFFLRMKRLYFSMDELSATEKLIYTSYKLVLPKDDLEWMNKCIIAYFKKKDTRKSIDYSERKALLEVQNYKCAVCKTALTLGEAHIDHIIPWDYVGDELENNLQALCSDCNLHKSNHVANTVKNIIIKMEV